MIARQTLFFMSLLVSACDGPGDDASGSPKCSSTRWCDLVWVVEKFVVQRYVIQVLNEFVSQHVFCCSAVDQHGHRFVVGLEGFIASRHQINAAIEVGFTTVSSTSTE